MTCMIWTNVGVRSHRSTSSTNQSFLLHVKHPPGRKLSLTIFAISYASVLPCYDSLMPRYTYYAQNYASIIRLGLVLG